MERYTACGVAVHSCLLRWPSSTLLPSYRVNRWFRHHLVFTFPWRLASLLKRIEADLVNSHVTPPEIHLQAKAVLGLAHLPWIWTIRGLYRSRGEDVSKWKQVIDTVNNAPTAAVTAVSQAALNEVLSVKALLPGKGKVISNGIDLSKYKIGSQKNIQVRETWPIPADAIVFGTAGRLIEVKRMDLFIEAAIRVLESGCKAHFLIAGDGPLRNELASLIDQSGFGDQIHLAGYQADMQAFFQALDVFVLCSDSEGMPNALLEACAMQLPCIATAVGGVPEILSEGAGILVQPGCATELADAMKQMLSYDTRKTYAGRARSVAEKFSSETMCRQYAALYENLLSIADR